MKIENRITELFNIEYPIIQGGMVWASGWKLASAVSNCGGLGLIGAGSMKPELLKKHIQKCQQATDKPFGVNLPLLRADADDLLKVILEEKVKIVFTSAGNPAKYTQILKEQNIIVVHVIASLKFALKAEQSGCDAIVAEGVEAGGHNGLDEITTFSLIPYIAKNVKIPVIAAGGISTGSQILAALALGAEAVQIGTAFAATMESSAHEDYKQAIINSTDNSTRLILKNAGMARVIKNKISELLYEEENKGTDANQLKEILGKKKEMAGIFEGDIENGLLEAGQSSSLIDEIFTVKELFEKWESEFIYAKNKLF